MLFRFSRPLAALALIAALPLSAEAQAGEAFGFSSDELRALFSAGDTKPLLELSPERLSDSGVSGPAAFYYTGLWLDSRAAAQPERASADEERSRSRILFRMAFDGCSGAAKRDAGLALIESLADAAQWDDLLGFAAEYEAAIGPEWRSERPRLEALEALKKAKEEAQLAARLATAYPAEEAKDADALAYFAAAAALRSGAKASSGWSKAFRSILLEKSWNDYASRAYALLGSEERLAARFTEAERAAATMREAVYRRDYGAAYTAAKSGQGAALSSAASRNMVSDAGKAFLYSGMSKEGAVLFAALEEKAKGESAWTALFYRARFERALGSWETADKLFSRAATKGPTLADSANAAWYAADSFYQGAMAAAAKRATDETKAAAEGAARAELLRRLAKEAARAPDLFGDLALALFRDALRARDWALIESMAESLASKLPPEIGSRLSYAAARAFELGLAGSGGEALDVRARAMQASARYGRISSDEKADDYYRLLAAWRAGSALSLVSPNASTAMPEPAMNEEAQILANMARFGLADLALAQLRLRRAELDDDSLRGLAALFASLGRQDLGLRAELELAQRPSFSASGSDYELLYPRPYLFELRDIAARERLPEELAYGLMRSESAFAQDAISAAGAVGLSQLMPSTAAAQAKKLGLSGYDLKRPADNMTLGLAYYASLLDRVDNRAVRAMMAYNAGPGRLKSWLADSGDLVDDLLVEALSIDETRQYCRNIVEAAAIYGELYYGKSPNETLASLFAGN
jgi:Soluble lytic murein transglycosylase and related regulatory proteins (some contain LysM/invasin domains)